MKIYLIRHGQDEDNAADILNGRRNKPLTMLGVEQANTTAEKIFNTVREVDAIFSSPLQRAQQTAHIIAHNLGSQKVITEDDLIERDFGVLTGKPRSSIQQYSTNNINVDGLLYFLNAADAETFPATYERAARVLEKVRSLNYKTVLLIAHRDICAMLQAAYYGWGWEKGIRNAHMENAGIILLGEQ